MHQNENQPLDRHTPCTMDSYFCEIKEKFKKKIEQIRTEKMRNIKLHNKTKKKNNKKNRDTHTCIQEKTAVR